MACHSSLGLCFPVFESNRFTPRKVLLSVLYSNTLVPHFILLTFSYILVATFSLPRFSRLLNLEQNEVEGLKIRDCST